MSGAAESVAGPAHTVGAVTLADAGLTPNARLPAAITMTGSNDLKIFMRESPRFRAREAGADHQCDSDQRPLRMRDPTPAAAYSKNSRILSLTRSKVAVSGPMTVAAAPVLGVLGCGWVGAAAFASV